MFSTRQDRQAWALLLPLLIIMLAVTGYDPQRGMIRRTAQPV